MKKQEESVEEMRHEVIEYSILLENYLDDEITNFFGFNADEASNNLQLEKEMDLFKKLFLNNSLSRKFMIIRKIIKFIGEKLYDGFGNDEEKFREIRNEFAHSFAPDKIENNSSRWEIKEVELHKKDWKKKYEEADELFYKIIGELDDKLYLKNPRRKRYREFKENEKLEIIRHYEKLFTKK